MRVGIGYDVHRIAAGSTLMLGGVRFEAGFSLDGHSDADVALHALTDALLGAAALGDIGQHFPPTDPRWRGADSTRFLRAAVALLRERGWRPANVDVTIVAERPRVASQSGAMNAAIAAAIGVDPDAVSVKATTNEGIGFIGRGEGIAALAVATIERVSQGTA